MASGFFTVGVTGLNAAQLGIQTTSHNIANASTEGYSRQVNVQTANTPLFSGAGFIGQGTSVESVRRVYSDFLNNQALTSQTNVAQLQAYSDQIGQIDNLLADPSAGLSSALQGLYSAIDAVSSDPASIPSRQAMLSAAQSAVARFHAIDQQLTGIREGTNSQIVTEISTVNSLVTELSDVNQRIIVAQAGSDGQPANDLYDQRDKLLADLNKEVRVSKQVESDGSYSVFFGSGQPLIVGAQTYQLQAMPSSEDLSQMEVALKAPSGQVMQLPESLISGGKLGGLLTFRSQTLDTAQNGLGRIAYSFATQFNAQHRLGQDLTGVQGGDFFKPMTLDVLGAPANVGTATVSTLVTESDYQVTYAAGQYSIVRLADNELMGAFTQLPQVVDGVRISLASGAPASGDIFVIKPALPNSQRAVSLSTNTGSAKLDSSGSNLQTLSDSDYRLVVTATNTFSLTRMSDGEVWTGRGISQAAALQDLTTQAAPLGFDLAISGAATVGDSFLLRPTRYGARDIDLAVTDARNIAVALPMRTSANAANAGTGTISAGSVESTDVQLSSKVQLTYEDTGTSQSLVGFPVGARVMVGATSYDITAPNQRVPFVAGSNISFQGVGFQIPTVPINNDTFVVGPNYLSASNGANLIISSSETTGATGTISSLNYLPASASVSGFPALTGFPAGSTLTVTDFSGAAVAGSPFTVAAITDEFTLPAGGGIFSFDGATVRVAGTPASAQAVSPLMTLPTTTSSMPAGPIDLTYRQASGALPARLTGFPSGTTVRVTLPNGDVRDYAMDDTAPASEYVPFTSGATLSFNGYSFAVGGAPVEGDRFQVSSNPSGSGDNRNALSFSSMQTAHNMLNGTTSYASAYAQIVSSIGNKAREIEVTQTAQENLVKQNLNAIQSLSGVNIDEEAANLMRYQQAYQAAAKMIETSSKLFDELMSLLR